MKDHPDEGLKARLLGHRMSDDDLVNIRIVGYKPGRPRA